MSGKYCVKVCILCSPFPHEGESRCALVYLGTLAYIHEVCPGLRHRLTTSRRAVSSSSTVHPSPPPLIPRGQEPSQSTLTLLRISSKQTYYTEKTGQDSSGGCRSSGFRTELNPRLVLGTIIASSMTSDGSTRVPYILWTVGLTAGLSTAAVLLRSFTRLRILHTFGADDALMLIAQILTMGFAAAIFAGELHPPPRGNFPITYRMTKKS